MTIPTSEANSSRITRVAAPLRQELLGQIREAIAAGYFRPGERLVERVLCEKYGVSRTVVREALRHLEAEGLVTILANRGPVVTTLTRDDVTALFEMRGALEALAASWFARRSNDADKKALAQSCDVVETAFKAGDLSQWLTAKDHYYDVMLSGAHSELIRTTVLSLHARVQLMRSLSLKAPGRFEQSLVEIREIADFAIAGDAEGAAAAAKSHVQSAAIAAFSQMENSPDVELSEGT